jgi:hypothetical protein
VVYFLKGGAGLWFVALLPLIATEEVLRNFELLHLIEILIWFEIYSLVEIEIKRPKIC